MVILNWRIQEILSADAGTAFGYTEIRSIIGGSDNVLQAGDLGIIKLDLTSNTLAVREKATIQIVPEPGQW